MFTSPRHCDSHISQEGHECVDICSTADRLGLSDNQVTALVSATLKAGGADLDKFVIFTTRRNRMLTRYHISQEYMAAFSEDPPKYAALHWDGKMLRDVLGSDPGTTSETLAVLVSGPPAYPEGKLLGVPVIDSSTGTRSDRGIHGFAGGMEAYWSDHCPCV
ncbi:hypothetical protein GWK47_020676 [Chionoecetes opilio]|uniref:Uncharacterized protein n=1 Tax=Chionoecetes opilio TaxID=41210 RepID=A0A8J4XPR7_CHIOP|nr:hypothetical protein GWK47_020676 [Chionoecetes opilio]